MNLGFSAGEMPANPLEKPGYRLEFHDDFRQDTLDEQKWLACYLPQWSSWARSAPHYQLRNGTLALQISAEQQPWCPEFDGAVRCSSLQTGVFSGPAGSALGQHRFNPACRVREPQTPQRTYTPQYGYFELRARGVCDPRLVITLWMIGFEDTPERSGEIAVMEIKGASLSANGVRVGYGIHPWFDPRLEEAFFEDELPIDPAQFHIYAVEWKPDAVDFYLDNQKLRTIAQSPAYPMQFMLGIYELPLPAGVGPETRLAAEYPKEFVIDYVRGYQPANGYGERAKDKG